jgi:hypothetical protein
MKPTRRVIYKLCADKRFGVYETHKVVTGLRAARHLARKMSKDVVVILIKKSHSIDVTNKVLGRPGPRVRLDKYNPNLWAWLK